MKKLTQKIRATENNLENVPKTSGVYVLYRGQQTKYVGSAGAGNLQQRLKQQLNQKHGITSFQYRTTDGTQEARTLEKRYRDRINPEQKRV